MKSGAGAPLETLDASEYQGLSTLTRKIHIYDGMTSSYHFHKNRDEIWTVLSGSGELILEGTKIPLSRERRSASAGARGTRSRPSRILYTLRSMWARARAMRTSTALPSTGMRLN